MATAYSNYRDSGLSWAPSLPNHWSIVRVKNLASLIQTGPFGSQLHNHDYVVGGTPVINPLHLVAGRIRPNSKARVSTEKVEELSRHKLQLSDIVFARRGDLGRSAVVTEREVGWLCGTGSILFRPISQAVHPEFLSRLIGTLMYKGLLVASSVGSTMANLNPFTLNALPVFHPPRSEQDQIVAYLRAQDAHIARFIKAKRELIGLLTEQKLRIIDHAVTRGLDASVTLKPSGIEWLGDVPGHWKTIHIGSAVQIVNGYPFDSGLFDAVVGHPLIRIRDLNRTDTEIKFNGPEVAEAVVQTGDLLVGMDGDFNAARWRGGRALLNQRMCCLRPRKQISTEYLALVMPKALKFINDLTLSTTVKHLSSVDVKRLRFPIPDEPEQLRIVEWVAAESAPLDEAIQRAEEEIKLIREYRDRLIADVVTGQVDVRGWMPGPDDVVMEEDLAALGGDEDIEPDGDDDDGDD